MEGLSARSKHLEQWFGSSLTSEVDGGDLLAGMAHFFGGDKSGFKVRLSLLNGELLACGATAGWGWPAGELLVADLGIGVAKAV